MTSCFSCSKEAAIAQWLSYPFGLCAKCAGTYNDGMAKIKTKSVYDPIEESDGVRVLVTRYHPRIKGFKKGVAYEHWLKDISPPEPLLRGWKYGGIDETYFREKYWDHLYDEMWYNTDDWKVLKQLVDSGTVFTLLCYEKEGEFCHRHILKDYLSRRLEVKGAET